MTSPGADILAVLSAELARNNGVFVGETHNQSFAAHFLAAHMRELRAQGVTTIYIELPHESLMALRDGGVTGLMIEEYGDAVRGMQPQRGHMSAWSVLTEAAQLNGVRIIGYDPVNRRAHFNPDITQGRGIEQRDIGGASVIEATRDNGKYIIIGGNDHSRAAGSDVQNPSEGLPERLRVPSIDFRATAVRGYYSIAEANDGSADYVVSHETGYIYEEGLGRSGQLQAIADNVLSAVGHGQSLYLANVIPSFNASEIGNLKSPAQIAEMLALIQRDQSPSQPR